MRILDYFVQNDSSSGQSFGMPDSNRFSYRFGSRSEFTDQVEAL